jgi:hypothetical protein
MRQTLYWQVAGNAGGMVALVAEMTLNHCLPQAVQHSWSANLRSSGFYMAHVCSLEMWSDMSAFRTMFVTASWEVHGRHAVLMLRGYSQFAITRHLMTACNVMLSLTADRQCRIMLSVRGCCR